MSIRAQETAITSNNILAGWRASGMWPFSALSLGVEILMVDGNYGKRVKIRVSVTNIPT